MCDRSSSESKVEIIERFLEHCQRRTPLPLGFLDVDEDVYAGPSDSADLLSMLTEGFSIEDLVESGIVVVDDEGAATLAPALADGGSILVIRDAVSSQPLDLLTHAGCLAAEMLPVYEILRDGRTQRLLEQSDGDLFVAFDMQHVVMLRACGLPATLGVGIDDLPLEQVDQFCETFGLRRVRSDREMPRGAFGAEHPDQSECPPDELLRRMQLNMMNPSETPASTPGSVGPVRESAEPISPCLVFLGWAPMELSAAVPLQLKTVVDYLHQLEQFMGVCLQDIGLWEVDGETIERLRFISEHRSAAIFKEALLDAAENIAADIAQFGKERRLARGRPNDYATAVARLHESSSAERGIRLPGPNQRSEARQDVQRLLGEQVIGPLREYALATNDPVERNLLMGFAELSYLFHLRSVAVSEQFSPRVADRGVESGDPLPEDQFKNLMTMADRLIGMSKVVQKCNPPRATIIETRTIDSTSIPRLPHSGS